MQDISKHYSFSLDTKATKLLKSNLVFNYGDDITFVAAGKITKDNIDSIHNKLSLEG